MTVSQESPLLEISGLSVAFSTRRRTAAALHGIDLQIRAGEIVALVGESGSGKTTLSRSIIGLLPTGGHITEGSIRFDGTELTELSTRRYSRLRGRSIALVPQDPSTSLNPVLSIGKQVSEVFRLHRKELRLSPSQIRSRSIELLELVGIDRPSVRYDQYPHELSGGMRQRVLIAIAFGLRPKLLIADEPTSALDVTVQQQVLDVLDDLAREFSVSVLFVTHNLAVATDRASRVVVMRGGRILETGSVEDFVHRPREPYSRELLEEAFAFNVSGTDQLPRDRPALSTEPAIVVSALNKTYPSPSGTTSPLHAVQDVSFSVARGSTFALVGESGSGKSTTANLILGLQPVTSGNISILGREVAGIGKRDRRDLWRDIQLVYQNPRIALDPRWTIQKIVEEPLRSFGIGTRAERSERVSTLIDQVGLPQSVLGRRPRELSGGQQQRAAIARALVVDAKIVVLDEALSALDVVTQAQILELLARLQDELGLTYLFISHDLAVVRAISDSVAVMRSGSIVEWGSVQSVFENPQHSYTQQLLAAVPGHRFGSEIRALSTLSR